MPLVMIESYHEFAARNGGEPADTGNMLIFPSGARCTHDDAVRIEPPDPTERLEWQRKYHRLRIARLTDDFNALQSDQLNLAQMRQRYVNPLPGPDPRALDELRRLKSEVERHRALLAEINAKLSPPQPEPHRDTFREEQDRKQADLVKELRSVEL